MKTPQTHEMIEHMFQELERPVKNLTEWEDNFLRSIRLQYETKCSLSDKAVLHTGENLCGKDRVTFHDAIVTGGEL